MESSIAVFLKRQFAFEQLPTYTTMLGIMMICSFHRRAIFSSTVPHHFSYPAAKDAKAYQKQVALWP
jgi:hypothetical protein